MRAAVLAVATGLLVSGCGGVTRTASKPAAAKAAATASVRRDCQAASAPRVVVCGYPLRPSMRASTIWLSADGQRTRLAGPARVALAGVPPEPVKNAGPDGFWVTDRVFRSPDGRALLAQWSGECEVQSVYLVSVPDGTIRGVFGLNEATAHGWTADGLARVRLELPIYAKYPRVRVRAGMYDVDPVTLKRTLERRLPAGRGC